MARFADIRQNTGVSNTTLSVVQYLLRFTMSYWVGLMVLSLGWGDALSSPSLAQTDAAVQGPLAPTSDLAQADSGVNNLDNSFTFLQTFPTSGQVDSPFWDAVDSSTVLTDEMTSDTTMSIPSLWYNRDQMPTRLGGRRLINSWTAYRMTEPNMAVVDVVINAQYWSVLNYLEQYGVLNQLGSSARDYGYSLRIYRGAIYNRELLGLYVCDFSTVNPEVISLPLAEQAEQTSCKASLDVFSIRGYQGISDERRGN